MTAQDAVADGVKCPAPDALGRALRKCADALQHLAGGLVGERERRMLRGAILLQQPGHAIRQSTVLPLPAPAITKAGPGAAVTAASC